MAASPDGIDLEALLTPISAEAPAGADLRHDTSPQSVYYRMRDARAEARAAERIAETDPKDEAAILPRWRALRALAVKALLENTKDLEVGAWLTEALVRTDGLPGFTAGARLLAGLAERFWDSDLYPTPDEDGIVTRVAPITGLNGSGGSGTLAQALNRLPLFERPGGEVLAFWQYKISRERKAGAIPFETVETEARSANRAALAGRRTAVRDAETAWKSLTDVMEAKAGADAPPSTNVRDLIAEIAEAVSRFAPPEEEDVVDDTANGPPTPPDDTTDQPPGGRPAGGGAAAASRDDMLRELSRIAAWFRKTEPHSPLAYTLDEAVRRGRMGWPELLAELVSDASTRHGILTSLGIRPPTDETG